MKFTIILTWLFVFSFSVFSQQSEDIWKVEVGWKGLLPFHASKTDVEKIFGKGVKTEKSWHWYQYTYDTEDAIFRVEYSGTPCIKRKDIGEGFNLSENTVYRYQVQLKQLMPITEFTFDKNRFERKISRSQNDEPLPHFSYLQFRFELWKAPNEWSSGIGIEFWGDVLQNVDYVKGFYYGPSHDDLEKYRCNDTDSQQPSVKNNERK